MDINGSMSVPFLLVVFSMVFIFGLFGVIVFQYYLFRKSLNLLRFIIREHNDISFDKIKKIATQIQDNDKDEAMKKYAASYPEAARWINEKSPEFVQDSITHLSTVLRNQNELILSLKKKIEESTPSEIKSR